MRHQVKAKQHNSTMCLVCGLENPHGLRTSFYELDNNELLAIYHPCKEHQGYPGRLHGGIAATLLDETIGRAIMILSSEIWGVTLEISTRYRKPVPLDGELRVVGRVIKETQRSFEGTGEILLPDGSVAVEGRGKYFKMALDQITDSDLEGMVWKVNPTGDDPQSFEL